MVLGPLLVRRVLLIQLRLQVFLRQVLGCIPPTATTIITIIIIIITITLRALFKTAKPKAKIEKLKEA